MVTKLEPKTEGTSGACSVCGSNVIWVEKSWQGKTSLTLRNSSDQKAHNVKSGDSWVCSTGYTQSVASKAIENKVVWNEVGELSEDEQQLVGGLERVRDVAKGVTSRHHPELSDNSTTFGQINNANMGHLLALMKIKAIKDSK
tara:strand:- start:3509 stop:3937 length:429 start_codon:yes stop_codon:yes gene_type:complete